MTPLHKQLWITVGALILVVFTFHFFSKKESKSHTLAPDSGKLLDGIKNQVDTPLYTNYKFEHPYLHKADSFYTLHFNDKAIEQYKKASELFEIEGNWEGKSHSLRVLGYLFMLLGKYDSAESHLEAALNFTLKKIGELHPLTANIYYSMGINFNFASLPEKALNAHQKALDLRVKLFGENHTSLFLSYSGIGNIHRWLRFDYYNAEKNYEKALKILEQSKSPDKESLIRIYYNLAETSRYKGDFEKALSYGLEALNMAEEEDYLVSYCYLTVANTLDEKGEYKESIDYFNKAIEISEKQFGKNNINSSAYYRNLGLTYSKLGNDRTALQLFRKSLQIYRSSPDLTRYRYMISNNYLHMGYAYQNLNQVDSSLFYYKKSEALRKIIFKDKNEEISEIYGSIGDLYENNNLIDSALTYYQKALIECVKGFDDLRISKNPLIKSIGNNLSLHKIFSNKGKMLKKKYFTDTSRLDLLRYALICHQKADSLLAKKKSIITWEQSKLFLAESSQDEFEEAIHCAYLLHQRTGKETYLSSALYFMEKNKSQILLEKLLKAEAVNSIGLPDSIKELELNLKFEFNYLKNKLAKETQKENANAEIIKSLNNKIFKLSRDLDNFNQNLAHNYGNYFQVKYKAHHSVLSNLKAYSKNHNTNIIQYFDSQNSLFAIAISPTMTKFIVIKKTPSLNESISGYLKLIKEGNSISQKKLEDYTHISHHLYNTLLKPLIGDYPSFEKLTIIPDGSLMLLPFEAFITSLPKQKPHGYKSLNYLLNQYITSYAYSADVLLNQYNKVKTKNNGNVLAFGYSKPSMGTNQSKKKDGYELLAGSASEVFAISKLLGGRYYYGDEASEENFKKYAYGFDILHLALHGTSDTVNNLETKLIFQNKPSSQEDGYLYPYELYALNLNARLAVLSACETGLGKVYKGEGAYSMARAFSYAGCKSIVMSLWKANDTSTKNIFSNFYDNLSSGDGIDHSLHQSKISYLNSSDAYTSHPSNWASFIMLGNTTPIYKSKTNNILIISLTTLLIVIGIIVASKKTKKQL